MSLTMIFLRMVLYDIVVGPRTTFLLTSFRVWPVGAGLRLEQLSYQIIISHFGKCVVKVITRKLV